ncbi:flavin prenyltransferase UbiX [Pleionea sediminis]|uniref:flavin prenyltransferase UbiX n=1 Tax=Pleionea sediminis TaxID=2569479 RepID=UPI0011850D61|nr:flavin prenyltransferase UbiX [Pleionea sediminis]
MKSKNITLGFTGASGAAYGMALLNQLRQNYDEVFVILSDAARVVFATELGLALSENVTKAAEVLKRETKGDGKVTVLGTQNWMSPVASGSAAPKQMIVCPCSTGTLSSIAVGASDNLLERAADVVIKERGQLILMPRETPFSTIHLQNMTRLSEIGVTIMPLAPGFYQKPESIQDLINFMVARVLDHLMIEHQLMDRWGYGKSK